MPVVHHRYATVAGHRLFFRGAVIRGARAGTAARIPHQLVLFRDLVSALADRYHVIAPDHLGFGLSDAPAVEDFDYTFDALTELTEGLLQSLAINRYAIYVQDYGAPIGWRRRYTTRLRSRRSSARAATPTTPASSRASGRRCVRIRTSQPPKTRRRYGNSSLWTRPGGNT